MKEVVKFVSAKPYLYLPDEKFNKVVFCVYGRKEAVIECSDELKKIIKDLPSGYCIPRYKDIIKWLKENGYEYTIDLTNTTTI